MSLTSEHLECVSAVYDAVLDPARWSEILDVFSQHMGGVTGIAMISDPRHAELEMTHMGSLYPAEEAGWYMQAYGAEEAEGFATVARTPTFAWLRDDACFPKPLSAYGHPAFLRERFGVDGRAVVRVNEGFAWMDAVVVHYGVDQTVLPPSAVDFAAPLLPHFQRLFALNRPFQLLRARFAAVVAALDRLHMGVAITDARGEVVLRNRACDRILSLGDGLALGRDRHLRVQDSHMRAQLDAQLKKAADMAAGENATTFRPIIIPRPSGEDGFILEIDALRGADAELEHTLRGAIVVLVDPADRTPVRTDGMSALYGFTPSEAAVLDLLIDGVSAPDIADARNVSVATVRTQLRSLAEKTGAPNRAALVRLALSLNPPVEAAGMAGKEDGP